MFAVIDVGGKQFTIREQDKLVVPRLPNNAGETITIDRVLLIEKDGKTSIGQPTVENAAVSATVIEHGWDDKIVVFKKKRRKDYRRTKGHRQDFTLIEIDSISDSYKAKKTTNAAKEIEPETLDEQPAEEPVTEEPALEKQAADETENKEIDNGT